MSLACIAWWVGGGGVVLSASSSSDISWGGEWKRPKRCPLGGVSPVSLVLEFFSCLELILKGPGLCGPGLWVSVLVLVVWDSVFWSGLGGESGTSWYSRFCFGSCWCCC